MHYSVTQQSFSRELLIAQISGSKLTQGAKDLLGKLSLKELRSLFKNQDLVPKIQEIANLQLFQALDRLRNDHLLDINDCAGAGYYFGIDDKLGKRHSNWLLDACNGYWSGDDESTLEAARSILLLEVRVNLWLRYLEYKNI